MGGMVEKQINDCISALVKQDSSLAEEIIKNDNLVDTMENDIEEKCVKLIARQQPLATDLRRIFATIKLVTDLERIADYAVDISRITLQLKDDRYIKPLIDIPKMGEIVQLMIKGAIDAYVDLDVKAAEEICSMDDQVDILNRQVFRDLLDIMKRDPETIPQSTQFLFISKFLERAGDHVTNVCEWIIYLVTGEHRNLND